MQSCWDVAAAAPKVDDPEAHLAAAGAPATGQSARKSDAIGRCRCIPNRPLVAPPATGAPKLKPALPVDEEPKPSPMPGAEPRLTPLLLPVGAEPRLQPELAAAPKLKPALPENPPPNDGWLTDDCARSPPKSPPDCWPKPGAEAAPNVDVVGLPNAAEAPKLKPALPVGAAPTVKPVLGAAVAPDMNLVIGGFAAWTVAPAPTGTLWISQAVHVLGKHRPLRIGTPDAPASAGRSGELRGG